MKKSLSLVTCILLLSFQVDNTRILNVGGSFSDWQKQISKFNAIRKLIDESSNLPNQEVKFITKTIDSFNLFVIPQLQKQMVDTTKKKIK